MGSEAVLACAERGLPVIAVADNRCVLNVDAAALGITAIRVESYAEAAGMVLALREGLAPESLRRPLGRLERD
jgi:hypothetical protein